MGSGSPHHPCTYEMGEDRTARVWPVRLKVDDTGILSIPVFDKEAIKCADVIDRQSITDIIATEW